MSSISAAAGGEMRAPLTTAGVSQTRLGGISAIVFVVLVVVSTFIAPVPPLASQPATTISAYYADNRGALLLAGYLGGLALIPVVVFIAALYSLIRDAEGMAGGFALASFGSAIISGVFATAATVGASTLAFTGHDADATIRVFFNFYQMVATFIWFPIAGWLLFASLVMLRMAGGYRWVGWLGLLDVIIGLLTGAGVARSGFFALGGLIGLVAFLVFALWVLATGILMLRRPRQAQ